VWYDDEKMTKLRHECKFRENLGRMYIKEWGDAWKAGMGKRFFKYSPTEQQEKIYASHLRMQVSVTYG